MPETNEMTAVILSNAQYESMTDVLRNAISPAITVVLADSPERSTNADGTDWGYWELTLTHKGRIASVGIDGTNFLPLSLDDWFLEPADLYLSADAQNDASPDFEGNVAACLIYFLTDDTPITVVP